MSELTDERIKAHADDVLRHAQRVLKNADASRAIDIETLSKWQAANDARYEGLREAHNRLGEAFDSLNDTYNAHLLNHARDEELDEHLRYVVNQNADAQRQQHWLVIGAIALAAFALGRQS